MKLFVCGIAAVAVALTTACSDEDSAPSQPVVERGDFIATEGEVKNILDKMLSYENPEADYPQGVLLGYTLFGVCTYEMNRGFDDCPLARAELERQLEVYAVDKAEFARGYTDGTTVGAYCGDLFAGGQLPPDMKYEDCIDTLVERFY